MGQDAEPVRDVLPSQHADGLLALAQLIEHAHSSSPVHLAGIAVEAAAALGADCVRVLLTDFGQELLLPLTATGGTGDPVSISGTLAGRAFTSGAPVAVENADGRLLVATPLLDGIERLGVLELTLHAGPTGAEGREALLTGCRRFADLLCQVIASKSRYTDELHVARCTEPMGLAAQMQWQLLPPLTAHTPEVTLAGRVEPAYHVGGDAFDYAVNRELAHVGVFDAMGHGVPASVTTALAVGAYRNCRRRRAGLVETIAYLDQVIADEFTDDRFVTAALGELDPATGMLSLVLAGHPAPLLMRDRHVVGMIEAPSGLPLGMSIDRPGRRRSSRCRCNPATGCCSSPTGSWMPKPRTVGASATNA